MSTSGIAFLPYYSIRGIREYLRYVFTLDANAHACEEHIVKRYGYTTVDAFMQVYCATKKVKDSYERKLAAWNDKYGQYAESEAKPRKSIKESLKENKEKVSKEKKERKVKRQKRTERE